MTATLERYMTRHPHSIRVDERLDTAAKLMSKLGVRHLPVLEAGALIGILSERDIAHANKLGAERAAALRVGDVCIDEPFAVDIDTSLFVVATSMAEKKIGSTIVLEDGKLAGIFTAVDVCRALADTLSPALRS